MKFYDDQTIDSPNPLVRYSHAARHSVGERIVAGLMPNGGALLDYGCGNAELLWRLSRSAPQIGLFGLEPIMDAHEDRGALPYTLFASLAECGDRRFDVISAFEVLEHLNDGDFTIFCEAVDRMLNPSGHLVISVPIMQGPILIPKYLNARLIKRSSWHYSIGELARASLLLGDVPRGDGGLYYATHKGFSWRKLRTALSQHFVLEREEFSPLPKLWWGLNSQWFAVLRKRD